MTLEQLEAYRAARAELEAVGLIVGDESFAKFNLRRSEEIENET